MKKSIMKTGIYIVAFLSIIIVSCESIEDTYSEFTKDGETVYIGTPVSISNAPSGINQVKLFIELNTDPKISKGAVLDNNNAVVKEFEIDLSSLNDNILPLDIELNEGDHTLFVVLKDNLGNESIKKEVLVKSYGENYRSELIPRGVQSYIFDGLDGTLSFLASTSLERGSVVSFTNTDGEAITVNVPVNIEGIDVVSLPKIDATLPLTYLSIYVPTPLDEDTQEETSFVLFESPNRTISLPLDLTDILASIVVSPVVGGITLNWTNVNNSEIVVNVEYTIDGNTVATSSPFSTDTDGVYTFSVPHGITTDFKIVIANRKGNGAGKFITASTPPNLALNKPGSASTEAFDTTAAELTNGTGSTPNWPNLVHTDNEGEESWFEIDLEAVFDITQINVYNRGDCCQERLSNYHVYISDVPFQGSTNADIQAQPGVIDFHETTDAGLPTSFTNLGITGRYIRIQTDAPQQYSGVAEIEVF